MHQVLQQNRFLVREQVGLLRAANRYDVYDPQTNQVVLECREENLSMPWKLARFAFYRRTPFDIRVRTPAGEPVLRVHRGPTLLAPRVTVRDETDQVVGVLRQRFFSLVEKFDVVDGGRRPPYLLVRSLGGRHFRFLLNDVELAQIVKQWAGLGREVFTSADTYEVQIAEPVPAEDPVRRLIVAAVIAIDMLLYE